MYEFDGIFDGDDVPVVRLVHVVDDGCQGRRFARTCRSRDQHQAVLQIAECCGRWWQIQLFERNDFFGDDTKDGADAVSLVEVVGAEARYAFEAVGEIQVQFFREVLPLFGRSNLAQQSLQVAIEKNRPVRNLFQMPVPTHARFEPCSQVQIRSFAVLEVVEELVETCHGDPQAKSFGSSPYLRAVSLLIVPARTKSSSESSNRHMPALRPVCMTERS